MTLWRELTDRCCGPTDLKAALARMRAARGASGRLDAARAVVRLRPSSGAARRVLEDEAAWQQVFFDRLTEDLSRSAARDLPLEGYRDLVEEARRFVTHRRAMAAAAAALLWLESARQPDNIGLTEAERLLRGFGYPALADRVRADIESVASAGHSGPIRERRQKGLPLPPPTRWSVPVI